MLQAVFFDIDGTLIDPNTQQIPPSTLKALYLLREKGVKLFVATGRFLLATEFLASHFDFDGVLSLNGQYCVDRNKKVLHQKSIDKEGVRLLLTEIEKAGISGLLCEEESSYIATDDPATHQIIREHFEALKLVEPGFYDKKRLETHHIFQILLYQPEKAKAIVEKIPHVNAVSYCGLCVDVIPADGGKHDGLAAVAAHYGFQPENIMAFGDGDNDRTMLAYAGVGVAMGNAHPDALKAADYITTPVWEDGIWNALKHFGEI